MSLTGNLEDLPLLDILQIVSFSKKTGALAIRTVEGDGGIVFEGGDVVGAFAWGSLPLDPRFAQLPAVKRAEVARTRIEIALEQLVRLREGQFNFILTDRPPGLVGGHDLGPELLERGINPQELLLELARGMDEDRRDSAAAVEASFAEPDEQVDTPSFAPDPSWSRPEETVSAPVPAALPQDAPPTAPRRTPAVAAGHAEAPPSGPIRTILLVDDEADVRATLANLFERGGYRVLEAEDPDSAIKTASSLDREKTPFVMVTDLNMPTSGGTSFQGGFEVVKRLSKIHIKAPVLMMAESLKPALRLRAQQMGVLSFVFKPGLSKLNPRQFEADLTAFAQKLLADVLPRLTRARPSPPAQSAQPLAASAARRQDGAAAASSSDDIPRQFALLQRRLQDLREPQDASQIAVLVMKVAREFFERGIFFLVKNDEARGLGGFGAAPSDESLNLLVREVVVPLTEASIFLDVTGTTKPFTGALPPGRWTRHLFDKIGRFQSRDVALLPLVTHRETIALLFGDNPDTGRELGLLDGLELFVDQAGIALERAFLQRKLRSLQADT